MLLLLFHKLHVVKYLFCELETSTFYFLINDFIILQFLQKNIYIGLTLTDYQLIVEFLKFLLSVSYGQRDQLLNCRYVYGALLNFHERKSIISKLLKSNAPILFSNVHIFGLGESFNRPSFSHTFHQPLFFLWFFARVHLCNGGSTIERKFVMSFLIAHCSVISFFFFFATYCSVA